MKKISEWLNELPPEIASEALSEMRNQGREDSEVKSLFAAKHMAFHWLSSKKGFNYWYSLFKNLS